MQRNSSTLFYTKEYAKSGAKSGALITVGLGALAGYSLGRSAVENPSIWPGSGSSYKKYGSADYATVIFWTALCMGGASAIGAGVGAVGGAAIGITFDLSSSGKTQTMKFN
jgi:hypothetical protein